MRPTRGTQITTDMKTKNFKKAWLDLLSYMGRYRKWFILAILLSFIGTALSLIGPELLSKVTDIVEDSLYSGNTMDMDSIVGICVGLVIVFSISLILNIVQNYIMATIVQRTASNFRTDISRKINRIPLKYFDRNSVGDVMSRVTNDVDTVGGAMGQSISMLVTSCTMLIGSAFMMLIINVTLAFSAILVSILGFVLTKVIMSVSQKHFDIQQKDLGSMNGHVEEAYTGHTIVKAYNNEENAMEEFDEINERLFKSGFVSQFLGGLLMPLMAFISNLGYIVVCILGMIMHLDGLIGFGTIVAFMMYIRTFTHPMSSITQSLVQMQSVAAAAERVFEFLNEDELEPDSEKPVKLKEIKGHVEFRNVHFGYDGGKEVIRGFTAEIQPGQKVAIVGPTGAGKTTLVNLLMRFYEVKEGDILIDGVSIRDMTREDVRSMFSMVLQDTWLFEGTLRENLIYNGEDVSDEVLDRICNEVGLHHFVETLSNGYDTFLSENSALSMGQRQQVTIARAMISDSPLLILDEATSSVDTKTEKAIQNAMDSISKSRTSFVIAHRLSTIRNSDIILVMRDGDIVEQGNHESLLAQGGFYSELYNSQFK